MSEDLINLSEEADAPVTPSTRIANRQLKPAQRDSFSDLTGLMRAKKPYSVAHGKTTSLKTWTYADHCQMCTWEVANPACSLHRHFRTEVLSLSKSFCRRMSLRPTGALLYLSQNFDQRMCSAWSP